MRRTDDLPPRADAARDEDYRGKSSDEIERDIERTRADMGETLDAIQRKLSPGELMDQALAYLRSGSGEFGTNLGRAIRDNPVPVVLIGICLAWLALSGSRGEAARRPSPRPMDARERAELAAAYDARMRRRSAATRQPTGAAAAGAEGAAGTESIRHLLERFPEDEATVRELAASDPTFEALCREYRQTEEELAREGDGATDEARALRERRAEIEEELLARIEGYRPV